MSWPFHWLRSWFWSWLRDYDSLQAVALIFIYIQIGCSLIGSLSAMYNGVLLVNLVVALFALVAIESSSQGLGRTYAVLLFCSIFLDIAWFIFFSWSIWNIDAEKFEAFFVFSLRLALLMQILGFSVRFLSSFIWIQMYLLGISSVENTAYREADFDVRNSFINPPAPAVARQSSTSDEILGGAIYDPAYYSSLFEESQDKRRVHQGNNEVIFHVGAASAADSPKLKQCVIRSFHIDDLAKPSDC